MEPLRDWLIGRGWTSELATIAAVLAAFLVAYLIGWIPRLLSKAPRARLLKSEEWKEPLEHDAVLLLGGSHGLRLRSTASLFQTLDTPMGLLRPQKCLLAHHTQVSDFL